MALEIGLSLKILENITIPVPSSSELSKTRVYAPTASNIDFMPWGLLLLLLCFFGMIGNILSAAVLLRPKMRSTYSVLTLGLTLCDAVHFFTKFFRYGIQSMFLYFDVAKGYTDIFFPTIGPAVRAINFTAYTAGLYMTVALAIDRYIAVCWPYFARRKCTRQRARWTTVIVILFSVLYNLPRWWEYKTEKLNYTDTNKDTQSFTTYYKMSEQPFRNNPTYKTYYIFWSYMLIMFLIPFVSLYIFNFLICRAISVSAEKRKNWTTRQKDENSFAVTLIAVVGVFLICSSVFPILDVVHFVGYEYNKIYDGIASVMLTLNSSFNFILYCLFGRRFRDEFVAFWCELKQTIGLTTSKDEITLSDVSKRLTGTENSETSRSSFEAV